MDKTQQQLQDLDDRLTTVEQGAFGTNPNTHPQTMSNLKQAINIPYTTSTPTYYATYNGTREFYFDGTNYWLYVWANGVWKKVQLS